jgi:ubiquinone/menaquinone biosynthesis C-methylase UbiE
VTRRAIRNAVPTAILAAAARPGATRRQRAIAAAMLAAVWTRYYARYRREGIAETATEFERLRTANWDAFTRHYNERVPTIEEEFDLWGAYHQHRHEMRYDLVAAAVRRHLPAGGTVLDVGCGSALVADRILDQEGHYVGLDFGGHHIDYAARKFAKLEPTLSGSFVRGNGEGLPFADASFDVVVMSEVIEHLLRPELAVWEVARVLRPHGVFVMTTNNASEVPLHSPLTHLFAWIEKALGAHHPRLISRRPWVWPIPVDRELVPDDMPDVYLPHTHHIQAETRAMFAVAGLETFHFSTFEFPPPQSEMARRLENRGDVGRRVVDAIEVGCRHAPLVNRLGCHLFMQARKVRDPRSPTPPPGVWPGPFSAATAPART